MRRVLCAAALTSVVLLGACSAADSSPSSSAPGAGVSPVAGPSASAPAGSATPAGSTAAAAGQGGDKALSDDSKAICAQAQRVGVQAGKTFVADLQLLIDAESAQDAASAAQAKEKTSRDVQNYSDALVDMASLASDPKLKQALSGMGKQVAKLKGDVRKLDADKLAALQQDLGEACGAN